MRFLFLAFFLLPAISYAQTEVYLKGVIGNYLMGDLKSFQDELRKDFLLTQVPVEAVSEFSLSLQAEAGVDISLSDYLTMGGFANYAVSSGRLHYGDYSGETYADQELWRINVGFRASSLISENFGFYGKAAVNYSVLKLIFGTVIYDVDKSEDSLEFTAIGFILEPGAFYNYPINERFLLKANLGFEINLNGNTVFSENKDAYLTLESGDPAKIDWSGLRLGIGMGFKIN